MENRKYTKNNKAIAFLKRNIYYIIMLVCLLAIATMVTITLINKNKPPTDEVIAPPSGIDDEDDDDDDKKGKNNQDDDDDDKNTGDQDEEDPPIVFGLPVANVNIITDYNMEELVYHPTLNVWMVSRGIDFGGNDGDAVCAVYDGVVESITNDPLQGHKVVIKHNNELRTIYYSLNEPKNLSVGQSVTKGQTIGTIGNTAGQKLLEGPLVHFAVTLNGKIVDPYDYLDIGDK